MAKQISLWTTTFLFLAIAVLYLPPPQRLALIRPLDGLKLPLETLRQRF